MEKSEILKYHILAHDDNKVNDTILITGEQEKLLLWLIENEYIDEEYWTFHKVASMEDITDLT